MTLAYHSTYVQAPSVAPTTSNTGTTYQVRHRRVNLDGGVSLWSPLLATNLPATITPQGYSDSGQLLRDEILVSNDAGVTWKVYPGGNVTGAQSVPAFDSNWVTTNNESTQNSLISNLDFGTFSDTETPSQELYVVNTGAPVNNLKVNFIDITSGSIAINYFDRLQVDLNATFNPTGVGSTSLYNQSFVWASPQVSFNNLELNLVTNGFFKMTLSFINYPASGGLASAAISLGMELVANQRTFFLGFGSDWLPGSYYVDQELYSQQFIEATSETEVVIKPYLVNINGVLFTNFGDLTKTVAGVDTGYQLVVTTDGTSKIYDSSVTVPAGETLLATFDVTGSSPWVDNFSAVIDIKPRDFGKGGGTVAKGRFVNINSSGNLELTNVAIEAVGISLEKDGYYASSGLAMVQVSESVSVGNRLSATTDGKGVVTSSGPVVVLESGAIDDLVLCNIISIQGPALSSVVASQVDVDDTGWTELGPASTVQDSLDQTDLLLSGLAEKFTKKRQVFTSSGTFTVPAKYVSNTLNVLVEGGGGGGGGGTGGTFGGGGGGAGGYSVKLVAGLLPSDMISVTIGSGGTAGTLNNDGGSGNTSSFGVHCSATGGSGGGSTGQPGKSGMGSSGDTNGTLGNGHSSGALSSSGSWHFGGNGGGSGGGYVFVSPGSTNNTTLPTVNSGGGGGGASYDNSGTRTAAQNGAAGKVVVTWLEYN